MLKFYDRFPSKPSTVSAAGATYTITFPIQHHKLNEEIVDQTIFTHNLIEETQVIYTHNLVND